MRTSTIAILAALGCALGIAAWIAFGWDVRDPAPGAGGAVPARERVEIVDRDPSMESATPPRREEVPPQAASTAPPEPPASSEAASASEAIAAMPPTPDPEIDVLKLPSFAPRERVPVSAFERKYVGFDRQQLSAAREAVEQALFESKKAAFDARREAGLFERRVITPGRQYRFEADGEIPLWKVFNTANSNESQVVVLPPLEYPEVYALKDELSWLMGQAK